MRIRPAQLSDIPDMSRVHAQAWRIAYKGIFPQQFLQTLPDDFWVAGFQKGFAKKKHFLVAEKDEHIVGVLTWGVSRHEDVRDEMEIYSLNVAPAYQNQGVGTALIQQALSDIASQSVYLLVVDRNQQARDFYEKNGFINTQQMKSGDIAGATFQMYIYRKQSIE